MRIATQWKKKWLIVVVASAVAVSGAAWVGLRDTEARDVDAAERDAVVALVQSWADGRARLLSGEAESLPLPVASSELSQRLAREETILVARRGRSEQAGEAYVGQETTVTPMDVRACGDGTVLLEADVETRLLYPPHLPAEYAGSGDRIVAIATRSGDEYTLSAVVPDHSADAALGILDVRPQEVGLDISWDEQADELRARC